MTEITGQALELLAKGFGSGLAYCLRNSVTNRCLFSRLTFLLLFAQAAGFG
jgi:hypothetical protein